MRNLILAFVFLLGRIFAMGQVCSTSGNVVVYANYDGGIVTINCDVNIPNLKIGICTYEAVEIHITGPFVGNVTGVIYAGYIGQNDNCGEGVFNTTVTGVSPGIVSILFAPPVTQADANGYPYVICGYSCGSGYQGGCNTSNQIAEYFTDTFGGSLYLFDTQYACWHDETVNVSSGGSCCPGAIDLPQAFFSASDNVVCVGQCIGFTDASTGAPTNWSWTFAGGSPSSSAQQVPGTICYNTPGTWPVTLTVSNSSGSNSYSSDISVVSCGVPGCTYSQALNYDPQATVDNGTCILPDCSGDCPADLDGNGIVNVTDLLVFISFFGTYCPE